MSNNKIVNILKSMRIRLVLGVILLILVLALIYLIKFRSPATNKKSISDTSSVSQNTTTETSNTKPPDIKLLQSSLDKEVDSVLYTFGIKKDWISTLMPGMKVQTYKSNAPKRDPKEGVWFVKDVLIPKDMTSAEINLDLSLFITGAGLAPSVNEDIRTRDIVFDVRAKTDSSGGQPLARIYITHSDKVLRETGVFCIILNNISDYKKDEIDNILKTTSEFTYIFPRSLENVELQNKLVQAKKDFIINLTVSGKDNSDADFFSIEDKDIRQRVKSFTVDFPSVSRVIITKADAAPLPNGLTAKIRDEFAKFNVRVINDSMLTPLLSKADEDSKDKIRIIINNLKIKCSQTGKGISVLTLSYDEFNKMYSELLILKKLGYKFYNLNEYFSKEAEKLKKDKLKEDKKTEETDKDSKKTDKKEKDKNKDKTKKPDIKTPPKKQNDKKK